MQEFWQQLPVNIIGVLALIIFNHVKKKQEESDDQHNGHSKEIQKLRLELSELKSEIGKLQLEIQYIKSPIRSGTSV